MRRTVTVLSISVVATVSVIAQDLALYRAREFGAQAKECLRVVDQDGSPVAEAKVWGGLQTGGHLNDSIAINGFTDTNGEYVVEGKCTNRIRCSITKTGYYKSEFVLADRKSVV